MQVTAYPQVNELLDVLLARIPSILSTHLIGLYLYGSLVTGNFDDISDADLLAATSSDIDSTTFDVLDKMHNDMVLHNALVWRRTWRETDVDHEAPFPETQRFVNLVIDRVLS